MVKGLGGSSSKGVPNCYGACRRSPDDGVREGVQRDGTERRASVSFVENVCDGVREDSDGVEEVTTEMSSSELVVDGLKGG